MTTFLIAVGDTESLLAPLQRQHGEKVLLTLLYQLVLVIVVARVFFILFRKIGQPGVVGEIAAGLVLGPSVFGYFFPGLFQAVFNPTAEGVDTKLFQALVDVSFRSLANVGLILLLFMVGLKSNISHLKLRGKSAFMISAAGVLAPFVLGMALALPIHPLLEPHPQADGPVDKLGFALFLGAAMSITALPVLSRIMVELGILRSRLGNVTIACAAVDDVTGWIILAAITGVVRGQFELWSMLRMVGLTLLFVGGMLFVGKPLLGRWIQSAMRRTGGEITMNHMAMLLAGVFLCAIATNLIGIFALFGAFFFGLILSDQRAFCDSIYQRMNDFITVFFLPLFFTYTGLRTDIGSLHSVQMWLVCGAVLLAAIVGKIGGCTWAAWLGGVPKREAACIGVLMNTRGLMELIVINIGYRLQVIPKSVFCMLVLMALVTTVMTTPLFKRLSRGTEMESEFANAGFAQPSASSSDLM